MLLNRKRNAHIACILSTAMLVQPLLPSISWAQETSESAETFSFSQAGPGARNANTGAANSNALKVRSAPVSSSGAYLDSISIDVPPGRLGMTPSLGLSYSSQNTKKSSAAGVGWSIGTSEISRSTRNGFPPIALTSDGTRKYDDASTTFMTPDGEVVPATDWPDANAVVFTPRREFQPIRYEYVESENGGRWIRHLPTGRKQYFGADFDDSRPMRINNELGTHAWLLVAEEDPHGNTITYDYHNAAEQDRELLVAAQRMPLLSKVEWGGNRSGFTHIFEATFTVDDIDHPTASNQAPNHYYVDMLNGHVYLDQTYTSVQVGNSRTTEDYWEYTFEFTESAVTHRLLLQQVKRSAPTALNPQETPLTWDFEYEQTLPGFAAPVNLSGNGLPTTPSVYTQTDHECWNSPTCQVANDRSLILEEVLSPSNLRSGTRLADFDGDGLQDVLYHAAGLGVAQARFEYARSYTRQTDGSYSAMSGGSGAGLPAEPRFGSLADIDGDFDLDAVAFPVQQFLSTDEFGISEDIPPEIDSRDLCTDEGFWNQCGHVDPPHPEMVWSFPTNMIEFHRPELGPGSIPASNFELPNFEAAFKPGVGIVIPKVIGGFGPPAPDPWAGTDVFCWKGVQTCYSSAGLELQPVAAAPDLNPVTPMIDDEVLDILQDIADARRVPGSETMTVIVEHNSTRGLSGPRHIPLPRWPRGVKKVEEIHARDVVLNAKYSVSVISDFLAPIVDINADGRQDLVLLKYTNTPGIGDHTHNGYHFVPRVYQFVDKDWVLEWKNKQTPSSSQFNESLFWVLGQEDPRFSGELKFGECNYGPEFPNADFNVSLMDVNGDSLPDLVVPRPPVQTAYEPICDYGHDVLLNRGYRWSTRAEAELTTPGETWGSIRPEEEPNPVSVSPYAHPLLLLRNRNTQCPAGSEQGMFATTMAKLNPETQLANQINGLGTSDTPWMPNATMSMTDINADGLPDMVFSYSFYTGSYAELVYRNTGKGFVLEQDLFLPDDSTHQGFAVYKNSSTLTSLNPQANSPIYADVGRLTDFDNDGLVDFIRSGQQIARDYTTVGHPPAFYENTGEIPDTLTKSTRQSGAYTRIDYAVVSSSEGLSAISGDLGTVPKDLLVVTDVASARGTEAATPVSPFLFPEESIELFYENFTRDAETSEAIGFEKVTTTFQNRAPDGTNLESLVVTSTYDVQECAPGDTIPCEVRFPFKGTRREVLATSGGDSQKSTSEYVAYALADGQAKRVRLQRTLSETCSYASFGSGIEPCEASMSELSEMDLDPFGYARVQEEGDSNYPTTPLAFAGPTTTTATSYTHNSTAWILGLPDSEVVSDGLSTLAETSWTYNATGDVLTQTAHDVTPTGCTGPTDSTTSWAYNSGDYGLSHQQTLPRGRAVTYGLDSYLLAAATTTTSVTRYDVGTISGSTTLSETALYDYRFGSIEDHTDLNGQTWKTTFDSLGRVDESRGPGDELLSKTTYFDAAASGSSPYVEVQTTRGTGTTTSRTYANDAGNALATVERPDTGSLTWAFGGSQSAIRGRTSEYDAFGRATHTYLPRFATGLSDVAVQGGETAFPTAYDGFDRIIEEYEPRGYQNTATPIPTTFAYRGRSTVQTNPNGNKVARAVDWRGDIVDVSHQSVGGVELAGFVYGRDGLGRLVSVTDTDGTRRDITLDGAGRPHLIDLPHDSATASTGTFELCYTVEDELLTTATPAGRTSTATLDELGRTVSVRASSGPGSSYADVVTYLSYDEASSGQHRIGRLWKLNQEVDDGSSVTPSGGTWEFSYDTFGRPASTLWSYGTTDIVSDGESASYGLSMTYDRQGLLQTMTLDGMGAGTATYTYTRDASGIATSVSSDESTLVSLPKYDAQGRLRSATNGNNTSTTWSYDSDTQHLSSVTFSDPVAMDFGELVYSAYDDNGNVGTEERYINGLLEVTKAHEYNDLDRLVRSYFQSAAAGVNRNECFAYSDSGNFLGVSNAVSGSCPGTPSFDAEQYSYSDTSLPQAVTSVVGPTWTRTLSYDDDGFLTSDQPGTWPGRSTELDLHYDATGCLRLIQESDTTPTVVRETEVVCGADGNRLSRISRDFTQNPATSSRIIYLGKIAEIRPDEDIAMVRLPLTGTTVVEESRSLADGTFWSQDSGYVHLDMRGSVLAKSSYYQPGSGPAVDVIREAEYGAWGETISLSATAVPRHQFVGFEPDPGTGHYAMGKRVYDPTLRRWLSPDPLFLVSPDGALGSGWELNIWSYGNSNPVMLIDKTGQAPNPPSGFDVLGEKLLNDAVELKQESREAFSDVIPALKRGDIGTAIKQAAKGTAKDVQGFATFVLAINSQPEDIALAAVPPLKGVKALETASDLNKAAKASKSSQAADAANSLKKARGPNGGAQNAADTKRLDAQRVRRAQRREKKSRDTNGQKPSGEGFRDKRSAAKGESGRRSQGPDRRNNRERNVGADNEEHTRRKKGNPEGRPR